MLLRNPRRARDLSPRIAGGDAATRFHRRLPGYAPTPVVDAPPLGAGLGLASLHVKDESARLGLPSFKILGASWAVYRLLVDRLGAEPAWRDVDELRQAFEPLGPLTLAAATDGNHGRAVAHMARLLGHAAHIFVPAGTADARIDGIASEGAHVTVVDGTYDDAVRACAAHASGEVLVVSDTSWEGYTTVPRAVIDGYSTIFAECDAQLPVPPDLVVVPMGVGALAAAAVRHYGASAEIVVVEPETAACGMRSVEAGHPVTVPGPHPSIMAGLNCGTVSVVAWPDIASGTDAFVTVTDAEAERAMRDLGTIGVVAGETGAAALAGLRAALADPAFAGATFPGRDRRALVLCTEGATDPVAYRRIVGREP